MILISTQQVEEFATSAFYGTDTFASKQLSEDFPNGCSIKEAIMWAHSLPDDSLYTEEQWIKFYESKEQCSEFYDV